MLAQPGRQSVKLLESGVRVRVQGCNRHYAGAPQVRVVLDAFGQLQKLRGARTASRSLGSVAGRRLLGQGDLHQAVQTAVF